MELKKLIIDYYTLHEEYENLAEMKDTIFYIPLSSLDVFYRIIKDDKISFDYIELLTLIDNHEDDYTNGEPISFIPESNNFICVLDYKGNNKELMDEHMALEDIDVVELSKEMNVEIYTTNPNIKAILNKISEVPLEKFVTDHKTFFLKLKSLQQYKNCIFYIPVSTFDKFKTVYNNILDDKEVDESKKENIRYDFERFINLGEENIKNIDEATFESPMKLFDIKNNVNIIFVGKLSNEDLKDKYIPEENLNIINTALYESASVITCSKPLVKSIEDNNISIARINV